jgi:hypothetical protein
LSRLHNENEFRISNDKPISFIKGLRLHPDAGPNAAGFRIHARSLVTKDAAATPPRVFSAALPAAPAQLLPAPAPAVAPAFDPVIAPPIWGSLKNCSGWVH